MYLFMKTSSPSEYDMVHTTSFIIYLSIYICSGSIITRENPLHIPLEGRSKATGEGKPSQLLDLRGDLESN